jgi:hypothetical protein
VARTGRKSL